MRLFAAVVPPAGIRERIGRRTARWREELPRASWVRPENLHLTLAFLGEVDPAAREPLERSLAKAVTGEPAFRARTGAVGAFPDRGPVRVVWVELEPEEPLAALASRVRRGIDAAGVGYDAKPFRSHLTLARSRPPWPPASRRRLESLEVADLEFRVDSVALIESVLGAGGSRYRTLAELRLEEAA